MSSLDKHITNFLSAFRANKRPFAAGREKCGDCSEPGTTYCENCEIALCVNHADSETYSDVDICRDSDACDKRLAPHWECIFCRTRVYESELDLAQQTCDCGQGKGRWQVKRMEV